jgi:hypothetical protein
MPRRDRAKQFAPFDALKGLHEALKLKEYEHDRGIKGDISQETIEEISKVLLQLKNGDNVNVKYFCDGYYKATTGKTRVDIFNQILKVDKETILFDDIVELKIINEKTH